MCLFIIMSISVIRHELWCTVRDVHLGKCSSIIIIIIIIILTFCCICLRFMILILFYHDSFPIVFSNYGFLSEAQHSSTAPHTYFFITATVIAINRLSTIWLIFQLSYPLPALCFIFELFDFFSMFLYLFLFFLELLLQATLCASFFFLLFRPLISPPICHLCFSHDFSFHRLITCLKSLSMKFSHKLGIQSQPLQLLFFKHFLISCFSKLIFCIYWIFILFLSLTAPL